MLVLKKTRNKVNVIVPGLAAIWSRFSSPAGVNLGFVTSPRLSFPSVKWDFVCPFDRVV